MALVSWRLRENAVVPRDQEADYYEKRARLHLLVRAFVSVFLQRCGVWSGVSRAKAQTWAVCCNWARMAFVFWKGTTETLTNALVASALSRGLSGHDVRGVCFGAAWSLADSLARLGASGAARRAGPAKRAGPPRRAG